MSNTPIVSCISAPVPHETSDNYEKTRAIEMGFDVQHPSCCSNRCFWLKKHHGLNCPQGGCPGIDLLNPKCMWDNCETIHIDVSIVRKLIIDYAKGFLTPKQLEELVPVDVKVCEGGVCEKLSGKFKVFFCEEEFIDQAQKR